MQIGWHTMNKYLFPIIHGEIVLHDRPNDKAVES